MYPLAWDFPQFANTAEHMALMAASQHLKEDPVPCVSDCLGVVNTFRQKNEEYTQYNRPNAGFWWQLQKDNITEVIKVKAHQSYEQAKATGQQDLWDGNFRADVFAKKAARIGAPDEKQAEAYIEQQKAAMKVLVQVGRQLKRN